MTGRENCAPCRPCSACGRRWYCRAASENWHRCRSCIAAAALLPFFGSGYWLTIGVSIAMFTVLATSWTLFSGPTNYISLATAAFFGIGMYIVAAGLDLCRFQC